MNDEEFEALPERTVNVTVPESGEADIEVVADKRDGQDVVVAGRLPAINTVPQMRERMRGRIAGLVALTWAGSVLLVVIGVIADWVTWDEIQGLFTVLTPVATAVIGFYFGSQDS